MIHLTPLCFGVVGLSTNSRTNLKVMQVPGCDLNLPPHCLSDSLAGEEKSLFEMPKRIFKSSQIVGSCASERGKKKKKSPVREREEERGKSQQEDKEGGQRMCSALRKTAYAGKGRCSSGIKSRLIKLINAK